MSISVRCPYCSTPYRQTKWGKTSHGSQKYRCCDCQQTYTLNPKTRGMPSQVRDHALRLHAEGHSFRGIGRALNVHHQSVINWIRASRDDEVVCEADAAQWGLAE